MTGKVSEATGKVLEAGKISEATGQVSEATGKVLEAGKISEAVGKVSETAGKVSEMARNDTEAAENDSISVGNLFGYKTRIKKCLEMKLARYTKITVVGIHSSND